MKKPTIEELKQQPALFYSTDLDSMYIVYPTGKVEYAYFPDGGFPDGGFETSSASGDWGEIEQRINDDLLFLGWL